MGLFTLVACSEDAYQEADKMNETRNGSVENTEPQNSIKTNTPTVGYVSPFNLGSVINVPMKFVNNTTDYQIGYRVQVGPGYFDGDIDGQINYSAFGGPILNPTNAPNLLYLGKEFNPALFVQYVLPISSGSSSTLLFNSFTASSPLNPLEVNFLRKYGKVYSVYNYISHNSVPGSPVQQLFLKSDSPPAFTSPSSIPGSMTAVGYNVVPGVTGYNPTTNTNMGILAYHAGSREIMQPQFPNFRSDYTFTTPYGDVLHLYFKSYLTHVEVVLEQ